MRTIELTFVTGETSEDDTPRTTMTTIFVDKVRNFHARKYGEPGTRIVFETGAALAVAEDYEAVKAAIQG